MGAITYVMAVENKGGAAGWQSKIFVTNATTPTSGWVAISTLPANHAGGGGSIGNGEDGALSGSSSSISSEGGVGSGVDAPCACPCIRYVPEDEKFYVFGAGSMGSGKPRPAVGARAVSRMPSLPPSCVACTHMAREMHMYTYTYGIYTMHCKVCQRILRRTPFNYDDTCALQVRRRWFCFVLQTSVAGSMQQGRCSPGTHVQTTVR